MSEKERIFNLQTRSRSRPAKVGEAPIILALQASFFWLLKVSNLPHTDTLFFSSLGQKLRTKQSSALRDGSWWIKGELRASLQDTDTDGATSRGAVSPQRSAPISSTTGSLSPPCLSIFGPNVARKKEASERKQQSVFNNLNKSFHKPL